MDLPEARRLTGMTQSQLDDEAELTRGTVADLETGRNKNPSHTIVTNIIRAFHNRGLRGVSADELFPVPELTGAASKRGRP
jgi:DNA-binding XRE family transcriptional regulator